MFYLGIDIGSVSADAVVIDDARRVLAAVVRPTRPDMAATAEDLRNEVVQAAEINVSEIAGVVSTGYGRETVSFRKRAITEIICHARGAAHLCPNARLLIDMGGQDTKAILLTEQGWPDDFAMNDKCAAGTGRFLEVMAAALHVPIKDAGRRAMESKNKIELANTCTVFGESEVISLISQGVNVADILAALNRSVAQRIAGMLSSLRGAGAVETIILTGGVAHNAGVVSALREILSVRIVVPESPQTVGALGAALIALQEAAQ